MAEPSAAAPAGVADSGPDVLLATKPHVPRPRPAPYDPAAFRAFWMINGMICPPGEVYTDPDVVTRTQETLSRHGTAPPVAQPTQEQLLTALTR